MIHVIFGPVGSGKTARLIELGEEARHQGQARARAGDANGAASLRRAAVREIARWSENIPLGHDLFSLARGLDADSAVLDAITSALRTS